MYWANFLHIYQPPTQKEEIVRKVNEECYRPLVETLKKHKNGKITLNINACLTEQLIRYHFYDVVDGLGELAQNGQIEFTGSAKYHPVLPLIPEEEVERQIELNQKSNEKYFRGVYKPNGFFPPEMCYSRIVAEIIKKLGFEWIIVDEISYNGKLGQYENDHLYFVEAFEPLRIFFKERKISAAITYGKCKNLVEFKDLNRNILTKNIYLLTGTDGEVYGHHRPGQEKLLIEVFENSDIQTCTISELETFFKKTKATNPVSSSWSTWEDEIEQNIPYPQWDYPGNEIHKIQWELAKLAINLVNKTEKKFGRDESWQKARTLLDEGLHSCQWWWVSCRPWWDTQMADRGAEVLSQVILNLKRCEIADSVIEKAIKLKENIHNLAKKWHLSGKAKKLQDEYMKSHGDVTSLLTFG
ncbi:MAG TPA: hypothetical protein DHV62_07920 [Elusimicrobia bacterium]|jgi:predicted glycosyl hydrolase (DUF1957 family)|nr:hypothetical protein [Elusimicrobiota bacterium]